MLACLALLLAATPEPGLAMPRFSLQDPRGRTVTEAAFAGRSGVLVVTTPTVDQGGAQEGWSRALDALDWPDRGPWYAFLEDLSQSWFKDLALGEIRAKYDPPPPFLIDVDGALRKALGVPASATMVLVFDPRGKLVLVERGAPTAERGRAVWRKALELMGLGADAGVAR
jgi:hypothetical protein